MLRLQNLSNKYRKRTLRAVYTHTQGTPYSAVLDSGFNRTQGQLAGAGAITDSKAAIMPGSVMVKTAGETVTLSAAEAGHRPMGLSANFVGGELDELGTRSEIGVWRGTGSVYQILAPAFDDTDLAAAAGAEDGAVANEVYMESTAKGVLSDDADAGTKTARLVRRLSANAIIVELLV